MNFRSTLLMGCLFGALGAFGTLSPAVAGDGSVEILTRGPVHEAFAEVVSFDPEPGLIVAISPPTMIEELPPEHQLTGDNIVWISGYWAWDPDQENFLWISGVWRALPPGRQWVPGYWNDLGGRFQWISGYWADAEVTQVSYLPAPPRTVEIGPNVAAPSANHNWIPGYWSWHQSRYAWRPGQWAPVREHWTYVPARYLWTPRGHLFVDGYWDYTIVRRGVLFAPVYFHSPVYATPGYFYRPSTVISLTFFTNHLFLRPNYGHYYFGDYYAPRYRDIGLVPIFEHHRRRGGYDPIYAYDRWHHRNDRDWERRHRQEYDYRRDNERARPPRTWTALQESNDYRDRSQVAAPLDDYARREGKRFQRTDRQSEQRMVQQRQEVTRFRQERERSEIRGTGEAAPAEASSPAVRERSRSPLASTAPPVERSRERGSRAGQQPLAESQPMGTDPRAEAGGPRRSPETKGRERQTREAPTPEMRDETGRAGRGTDRGERTRPSPEATPPPSRAPERVRESEPQTLTQPQVAPRQQPPARTQPQVAPRQQPQTRTQPQVAPRQQPPARTQPQVAPRQQPPARTQPQVAPRQQPQTRTQPQVAPRQQPQTRTQPQVAPRQQPQTRTQPQVAPRQQQQTRTQPQVAPRQQPQTRSQPQVAPRQQPPARTQPQVAPRQQPQTRTQPQVAPRQQPSSPEPQRESRGRGGERGGERGERGGR